MVENGIEGGFIDRYTLYTILIPGIIFISLGSPLLPLSVLNLGILKITLVLVLLLGLAFVFGMLIQVFSEVIEHSPTSRLEILETPSTLLQSKLNGSDNLDSFIEKEMFDDLLYEFQDWLPEENHKTDVEEEETQRVYFTRQDSTRLYQYMLTRVWREGESPSQVLFETRIFSREMVFLSLSWFIIYGFIIIGANLSYQTIMSSLVVDSSHMLLLIAIIGVVFYYGNKRYSEFVLIFILSAFLQQR
jgi:hypothetical protein